MDGARAVVTEQAIVCAQKQAGRSVVKRIDGIKRLAFEIAFDADGARAVVTEYSTSPYQQPGRRIEKFLKVPRSSVAFDKNGARAVVTEQAIFRVYQQPPGVLWN